MNDIDNYCINNSENNIQLLKDIQNFTFSNEEAPQMISGEIVGNLLKILIKASNAQKILEIGTFTGYSALNMAQAIGENGEIHTCEIMERHIENAKKFFNKSPFKNQFHIHAGDAMKTLEKFSVNYFDFAFIDADKVNYIEYYKKCMHLIKPNGIIVLDNMLWGGGVINPNDEQSITLNKLATIINNDDRNINFLLPIRDGLMICLKN